MVIESWTACVVATLGAIGMVLGSPHAPTVPGSTSPAGRQPPPVTLPCERALAEGNGGVHQSLNANYDKVFLGQVALPTRTALQAAPSDSDRDFRWFAKAGLVFRSGAEFELVVPRRWRGRVAITWAGTPATARLRVTGCAGPPDSWLGFPGGYLAREPGCVILIVKRGTRTASAHIGIGLPCPGQEPVPEGVPNLGVHLERPPRS